MSPAVAAALRLPRRHVCSAIVWRDYLTKRSYKLAFALDVFNGILTLTIYYFISRFFTNVPTESLNDAPSYFAFAAAGIITAGMITTASVELGVRLREEELAGTLETLVAQPVTPSEMCFGLAGFPFAFAIARALVYLVVLSVAIGLSIRNVSWIGLGCVLVGAAAAFAALAIASAALILVFKRAEVIASMFIGLLIVLSGSVFPISSLPDWLEPIAKLLPPHLAFDGVRNALFRGEGWFGDAVALFVIAAIALPLSAALFGAGLRAARKSGSLAQY